MGHNMRILLFTEGTILIHKNAEGHSRTEISKQVRDNEESIHDFASYIPIGKAVTKISTWKNQGADILYLTSRTSTQEIRDIQNVLTRYAFPKGQLLFRKKDEQYNDVAERILPDILIEDDCECIGGINEMTITHVKPEVKQKIKSIVIPEFGGIDYLPNDIIALERF
jgi:hypothetical protein